MFNYTDRDRLFIIYNNNNNNKTDLLRQLSYTVPD